MRFSIIIPAYNVADYLEECISSVFDQTFDDFEIILIDDGSTDDKTPQLADELGLRDKRLIVIHQQNGGLSEARNTGIRASSGEYILFLDGDDYWEEETFLAAINETIVAIGADCYIVPYTKVSENRSIPVDFKVAPNQRLTDKRVLVREGLIRTPAWNKVLPRSYFHKDRFFEKGLLYEDILWCSRLIACADSFVYIPCNAYRYRLGRANSIMNRELSKERLLHHFRAISLALDAYPTAQERTLLQGYVSQFYAGTLCFAYPYRKDEEIITYIRRYRYLLRYGNYIGKYRYYIVYWAMALMGLPLSLWGLYQVEKRLG